MAAKATLPPLATATAGAVGAAASNALVYPLDLITSRLQTQGRRGRYASLPQACRTIVEDEGILALYSGLQSDTLSTFLSNFIYFYCYQALHGLLRRHKQRSLPSSQSGKSAPALFTAPEELAIGSLAGVVSRLVTTPLSNITVRKQTSSSKTAKKEDSESKGSGQKENGDDDDSDSDDGAFASPTNMDIAREIMGEKGWTGFWSGFKSACILTCNPAITLYGFELLKLLIIPKSHRDKPRAFETFFASATASSLASTITYPLILAKTRQQWRSPSGRYPYKSMLDVIRKTIHRQGVVGLALASSLTVKENAYDRNLEGFFLTGIKHDHQAKDRVIDCLLVSSMAAAVIMIYSNLG